MGILPHYPNADVVNVAEFQGEAFGMGPASWRRVTLEVRAPYEQVRDFYASVQPYGWSSALVNETVKPGGKRYDRFLSDQSRRQFYVIQVREEKAGNASASVFITLASGHSETKGR